MSGNVIKKAFSTTEEDFLALVKKQWQEKPQIASVGSCCLVGIVSNGLLYVGNAGDSTAVLGRLERSAKKITPVQLSTEHNASMEPVRDELQSQHPDDPNIVVMKRGVWRVKGLIQVNLLPSAFSALVFCRKPAPIDLSCCSVLKHTISTLY